jgi:predicted flap endonuclease-1-like 5' DNA nuclease
MDRGMLRVARWAAAVMTCAATASAVAGDLWLQLADGKAVAVIDDGTAGPYQQVIERRNADGSLDLKFGLGGRQVFSLGEESLGPQAVRVDPQGRLLVVGTAFGRGDHSAPATMRFLPDGRPDTTWGRQGRTLAPAQQNDAQGLDAVTLRDNSVLLLGQVDGGAEPRIALWLLRSDGVVGALPGTKGALLPPSFVDAHPLGLQSDADGAALIAVLSKSGATSWLELHRWQPDQIEPQLIARQVPPSSWRGPVSLVRRGGAWQWVDGGTSAAIPIERLVAAVEDGSIELAPGHAGFNPFSVDTPRTPDITEAPDDTLPWLVGLVGSLLVVLLLSAWRYGSPRESHLGRSGSQAVQVEGAGQAPKPSLSASMLQPSPLPDDLKRIKGVGPVLECKLNGEGVYWFRQIAAWSPEDVERIETRVTPFKGRITRDAWSVQASALASMSAPRVQSEPTLRAAEP